MLLRGLCWVTSSWAALYCSLEAVLHFSFVAALCSSFVAVLCSSFVGCVDSLQAVLYRYFVGTVEVLFDSPGDERVPVPSFQSAYCLTFACKRLRMQL